MKMRSLVWTDNELPIAFHITKIVRIISILLDSQWHLINIVIIFIFIYWIYLSYSMDTLQKRKLVASVDPEWHFLSICKCKYMGYWFVWFSIQCYPDRPESSFKLKVHCVIDKVVNKYKVAMVAFFWSKARKQ